MNEHKICQRIHTHWKDKKKSENKAWTKPILIAISLECSQKNYITEMWKSLLFGLFVYYTVKSFRFGVMVLQVVFPQQNLVMMHDLVQQH